MDVFLIGISMGCLIGAAAAYLITSRPKDEEPPSWGELIDQQMAASEKFESNLAKPRAFTRLRSNDITWEI